MKICPASFNREGRFPYTARLLMRDGKLQERQEKDTEISK